MTTAGRTDDDNCWKDGRDVFAESGLMIIVWLSCRFAIVAIDRWSDVSITMIIDVPGCPPLKAWHVC